MTNQKSFFKRIMFRANRFITTEISHRKYFSMLFFSKPEPKYTLSTNRLSNGEKLIITSSVIKNVYVRPCLLLIRDHMQIYTYFLSLVYLALLWGLEAQFFKSMLMAENISCFEMTKFDIFKMRLLIQTTLYRNARIQLYLSKNNSSQFLSRGSDKLYY